jgi:hypothetical protein
MTGFHAVRVSSSLVRLGFSFDLWILPFKGLRQMPPGWLPDCSDLASYSCGSLISSSCGPRSRGGSPVTATPQDHHPLCIGARRRRVARGPGRRARSAGPGLTTQSVTQLRRGCAVALRVLPVLRADETQIASRSLMPVRRARRGGAGRAAASSGERRWRTRTERQRRRAGADTEQATESTTSAWKPWARLTLTTVAWSLPRITSLTAWSSNRRSILRHSWREERALAAGPLSCIFFFLQPGSLPSDVCVRGRRLRRSAAAPRLSQRRRRRRNQAARAWRSKSTGAKTRLSGICSPRSRSRSCFQDCEAGWSTSKTRMRSMRSPRR